MTSPIDIPEELKILDEMPLDLLIKNVERHYPDYNIEPIWQDMVFGVKMGKGYVETFPTEEEARDYAKETGNPLVAADSNDPTADFLELDL